MNADPAVPAPPQPRQQPNHRPKGLWVGVVAVGLVLVALIGYLSWTVHRQRAALRMLRDTVSESGLSQEATEASWLGLYSSPEEISGFTGTVLAIERAYSGGLEYRMTFYTDVRSRDDIEEPEKRGDVVVEGDTMYLPRARGYYRDGKAILSADIDRYTRRQICGRTVLLRDDALKAFTQDNKLYDYGILIKVADTVERFANLDDARHESIKVLYDNPASGWNDPFVNGPNER
jgi:hypothetical protein